MSYRKFIAYFQVLVLALVGLFCFVPAGTDVAFAAIEGNFQSADCSKFVGWVCDRQYPDSTVYVQFYLDGQYTQDNFIFDKDGSLKTDVPANLTNLSATKCGGSHEHGFSFSFPHKTYTGKNIFDGQSHSIRAVASYINNGGIWNEISPSRTITCSCTSNCSGKTCGIDGCGGYCGTLNGNCPSGQTCNSSGACIANCAANASKKCYNGDVYWYDSCGVKGELYDACASSETCSNGVCGSGCTAEDEKKCYNGDVYWYDSCGVKGELYDACASSETCLAGVCVANTARCIPYSSKKCDAGNVYWYDSCNVRGDIFQNCGSSTLTSSYQCSGNLLLQGVINKDCASGVCTQTPGWNNIQDCSATGKVCKNGVCVIGDSAAPVISGLAPTGTVYKSAAILTATTNEAADCRYSWYDKSFDQMTLAFKSSDKLYHSASASLTNRGDYIYYVRCKDAAGNTSLVSSKISFRYAVVETATSAPKEAAPADKNPPVISALAPSGNVDTTTTTISCVTDEKATCKYDIADTDYDSMENKMDANGTSQSKIINLQNTGSYSYYVRCKDASGNKNGQSAQISFIYALPQIPGPAISNPQPGGTVYQKSVSLTAITDKTSECRWSSTDQDFDAMAGIFSTADGQSQQAAVDLNDYGRYTYYIRCKDQSGNKTATSTVIGFEYKDPDATTVEQVAQTGQENPVACADYQSGTSDGACNNARDCVCDPDCPAAADAEVDPDCAGVAGNGAGSGSNLWIVIVSVALIILIVVALIVVMKKRGQGTEDEISE